MTEPCAPARFALVPHPAFPDGVISAIECALTSHECGLELCFTLTGRIPALRLPPPAPPRATDGLWQHTCCELFLARRGEPAYLEFNFSPSGEWARYAFRAPRQRIDHALPDAVAPAIACTPGTAAFELAAHIPAALLVPFDLRRDTLDVALCCVSESIHGDLAWWALHHPAPQPDFHRREGFMPLPPPTRHAAS